MKIIEHDPQKYVKSSIGKYYKEHALGQKELNYVKLDTANGEFFGFADERLTSDGQLVGIHLLEPRKITVSEGMTIVKSPALFFPVHMVNHVSFPEFVPEE